CSTHGDQVEFAVAVEIAGSHSMGAGVASKRKAALWLKSAVAVANQQRQVVGFVIARGQVDPAVAIEIAHYHTQAVGANRPALAAILKRPVAKTQEHGDGVRRGVGGGQVEAVVAIEIADYQALLIGANGEYRIQHAKRAVAQPQENGHLAGIQALGQV